MNMRIEQGACQFVGEGRAADLQMGTDQSSGNIEAKLQTATIQKYQHQTTQLGFSIKIIFVGILGLI